MGRAGDTIRLDLPSKDAPTMTLLDDGQGADTVEARGRGFGGGFHGGFHGGGFHGGGFHGGGFRGGFHSGFRGGFHGVGFRGGFVGSRRFVGFGRFGFARGFYGGFGRGYWGGYWPYYGGGYSGYYPCYAGYGSYYPGGYCPGVYYYPCVNGTSVTYSTLAPLGLGVQVSPGAGQPLVPDAPVPGEDGTYPYDGGPQNPLPAPRTMPRADPTTAPPALPLEGRAVSLPRTTSKYSYPAYGEKPRVPASSDHDLLIRR
jgi:hypothetical protein